MVVCFSLVNCYYSGITGSHVLVLFSLFRADLSIKNIYERNQPGDTASITLVQLIFVI